MPMKQNETVFQGTQSQSYETRHTKQSFNNYNQFIQQFMKHKQNHHGVTLRIMNKYDLSFMVLNIFFFCIKTWKINTNI